VCEEKSSFIQDYSTSCQNLREYFVTISNVSKKLKLISKTSQALTAITQLKNLMQMLHVPKILNFII